MPSNPTPGTASHRTLWLLFGVGAFLQLAVSVYASEPFECCSTSQQQARADIGAYVRVALLLLVGAGAAWTLRRAGIGIGKALAYAAVVSVSAAVAGVLLYVLSILVHPA